MKKLILILFILTTFSINAQFKYGVYLGTYLYKVDVDAMEFQNSKTNLEIGFAYNYLITEKFELLLEAGYSHTSTDIKSYDNEALENPSILKIKLNGLRYTALASLNVFDDIIAIQGGLSGDWVFSRNEDAMYRYIINSGEHMFEDGLNLNTIYSGVIGASVSFNKFRLNLRYARSINNPYKGNTYSYIDSETNEYIVNELKGTHSYFGINLHYYLTE